VSETLEKRIAMADATVNYQQKRIATLCDPVSDDEMLKFSKQVKNRVVLLDKAGVNALIRSRLERQI
jgi:uncharacterized coiled-coil protein SlyX